ncbi:MAG: IPT/TIG domain-containing protein [Candidatus Symbiothrix sp.]|jgi:hypothetical protein|nr:IPT/TIG domain-containing protein [Candidatus Symbiothrix sp.]
MKRKKTLSLWKALIAPCLFFTLVFTGCEDDGDVRIVPYDPSKPVTITAFSPDTGRVATQMIIDGENFGGNLDAISVQVNGKKAAVIGVNPAGTMIYCLVPSMRDDKFPPKDSVQIPTTIKVLVEDAESNVPEKPFIYTFTLNVSTFLGFTDQDGNTAIVDGPFEKAQFQSPFWLAFDTDEYGPKDDNGNPKKNIYLIEENNGLRFIDVYNREVKTIFRTGNGVDRPRTIAFTLNREKSENYRDTMIIANDHGDWGGIGTIIIPRDTVTRIFGNENVTIPWRAVMHHRQCNGGAIHPLSGVYWFNSYQNSQVYKVHDRSQEIWRYGGRTAGELNDDGKEGTKFVFKVQDNNWEFNIQIAPSGEFAYIVSKNQHYIAQTLYNPSNNLFENPVPFVGDKQKSGFRDGVSVGTLFWEPQQGAFDDENNFYVCDGENNCIRKVTPQAQVSTFAGRPGKPGYSDGALRDAQFDGPFGIIYDSEIETFYIADRDNRRIRCIKVE